MRILVIMAGGSGERFWPLSRRHRPKQLLPLTSNRSMLSEVAHLGAELVKREHVFIVTGAHLAGPIQESMPEIPSENLIIEPQGRNTGPCLAYAAAVLSARFGRDAVMGVLSADSRIGDSAVFAHNADLAFECAEKEAVLMTLGIRPTHPNTGFGYLELENETVWNDERGKVYGVKAFHEKPDEETARDYMKSGQFLWNSGMFFWRTSTLLDALDRHAADLGAGAREIAAGTGQADYQAIVERVFAGWPKISIDYAVMERADNVRAVAGEFDWDDVGTWTALARVHPLDSDGNLKFGSCLGIDTTDSILFNKNYDGEKETLLVTLGVKNLVVVQTDGAVLVCHKDRVQDIKQVLAVLNEKGPKRFL